MVSRFFLIVDGAVLSDTFTVIKYITFQTVYYLNLPALFALFPCFLGCIRERLHYAVICYGHSRLSPFCRLSHNCIRFVESIHGTHFGVKVQLHTLSCLTCVLAFLAFLQFFQFFEHDYIEVFKCVELYLSLHLDTVASGKHGVDFLPFVFGNKCLAAYGSLVVRNQKCS